MNSKRKHGGSRSVQIANGILVVAAVAACFGEGLDESLYNAMTYRIDRLVSGRSGVVFRVSGRVDAENVGTLRELLGREKGAVAIDFEQVTLADHEAVKLLAVCETKGTELRNCPAYIREWVSRERAQTSAELSDLEAGAKEDIQDV